MRVACAPGARTPEAGDGELSGCPESWVVVSSSSSSSLSSLASEVSAYAAHPWRLAYSRRACDATRHDSTRRRVASGEREMDDGEAVAGRWCNGSGDGDLWFGGGRSAASGRSAAGRRQGGGGGGGGLWFMVQFFCFKNRRIHTPNPLAPRPRPAGRAGLPGRRARAPKKEARR